MLNKNKIIIDPRIASFFGAGGIMSRALPGFEERPGQAEMACAVYQAFTSSRHAMLEAPCGVGKSFAYIIPSAVYAKNSGEKVVISTNTKTLQEQLKRFDLPTISRTFGLDFSYTVLKGKSNYICLRKLDDISRNGIPLDLFSEFTASKVKLRADIYLDAASQIARSNEPEFENLSHEAAADHQFIKMLACQSVDCAAGKCEHFRHCNYFSAVTEAAKSDIVVVNHALYFSCLMLGAEGPVACPEEAVFIEPTQDNIEGDDVQLRDQTYRDLKNAEKGFLNPVPNHDRVVFDEAHHIPDSAQKHFSISLSPGRFAQYLNMISHTLKKAVGKKMKKFSERLAERKYRIEERLREYFNYLGSSLFEDFSGKRPEEGQSFPQEGEVSSHSLSRQLLFRPHHAEMIVRNPCAAGALDEISRMKDLVAEAGEMLADKNAPANIPALNRVLDDMTGTIEFWKRAPEFSSDYVLWGSLPANGSGFDPAQVYGGMELLASPLVVSKILKTELFEKKESAVLTSATLSTDNNFRFIQQEVGLSTFDTIDLIFDSPFELAKQTAFIIPPVGCTPKDRNFNQEAARWIQDSICGSGGRTLVLFTSRSMMDHVYSELATKLKVDGFRLLIQGQEPQGSLLKKFKDDVKSSLFALDSFWEGVDIKGESLSTLVITKLPFKVPSHPLNEARDIYYRKQNRDPFGEFAIPSTVLKLKQGIGRLIRHRDDRGVLVILDTRLRDTSYGRKMISSLPPFRRLTDISQIGVFLGEKTPERPPTRVERVRREGVAEEC